ncbi:hypothetical protein ACOI1C_05370 [Bacillus sp. DJP31]|uniref:hypothetical protein n=1 Tax=Bacillus sp. DJP31 TaxID=3409789 RepID=UPI003BB6D36A
MLEKQNMPDFDSLSDRVIAKPTQEPTFAIKTNLDPESPEEGNPYYSKENTSTDKKKLNEYFGKS